MKYKYVYKVKTDNLCYGNKLLEVCSNLKQALNRKFYYEMYSNYGACSVYKEREYILK